MHGIFVAVVVLLINQSVSSYEFKEISFSSTVSNTVGQLINDFYRHKSSTLSIIQSAFYHRNYHRQMGVINEILYHTNSKIVFVIEDGGSVLSSTMHRYFNLIFVDSYEAFANIFSFIKDDSLFDYTGFYTIVLTESWRDQYIIITKILNDCWSVYITNVVVVAAMGSELDTRSAIYTYFPFTKFHCERVAPVILNYFINNSFVYDIEHFPDKLKNMHKCPLVLVTHNVTPFMILYGNANGQGYRTEGIDGITFRVLSQQLNFTPIIEVPSSKVDGSSYYMEMVMAGKANLTIGGFSFTIKRAELMSASSPHLYSSLLYAIPKGKPYTALEKLFLPFKMSIWILMGLLLLCALFATTCFTGKQLEFLAGERNHTPFLNTITVLFGGAVTVSPKRNFARTVLIIWIFGCIVVRSAFQGSLFEYIQQPRNLPSASSLAALIDGNYTLYMSTAIYQLFVNTSKFHENIRIHNFGSDEKYDILVQDSAFERSAVLTTDVGISYYNMKHYKTTGVVSSTKDRMFLLPFCIFFRKHSCLNEPITQLINKYTSSGLLEHWISNYFQTRFVKVEAEDFGAHQPQRLNVRQLLGGFIISSILLKIAFFVFLLEIMSKKYEFLNKMF